MEMLIFISKWVEPHPTIQPLPKQDFSKKKSLRILKDRHCKDRRSKNVRKEEIVMIINNSLREMRKARILSPKMIKLRGRLN